MAEALLVEHDATCRRLFATVVKSCLEVGALMRELRALK